MIFVESLITSIEDIIRRILHADPAIYRLIITDRQGMEIASSVKTWNLKGNEEKVKNPIYPLLNTICNNSEKFLGFMRKNANTPFIFTWNFEGVQLYAASSPYGFIGIFCEPDVNPGLVKKILKENAIQYNQLVAGVFEE